MTIALFKTLIALSDTGSIRGAADVVCVTHAAVGQQMRRLEETFNVTLFDRSEKTPRLNQLGKALVPKARDIVQAYETVLDDLTGDPQMIGELTLGAVPSTMRGLIPKSAKRLAALYPDLRVKVVRALSPQLLEQVEQGTLDAAVISQPVRVPNTLIWRSFAQEELVLLTASSVTQTDPKEILAAHPYIRHTRHAAVGLLAEEWLSKNKVQVNDAMEMQSLEDLASMVSHGLGVSVGPDICVPDAVFRTLRKIPLGPNAPSRTLGIITRPDCSKLQLVDIVLDQIGDVVKTASEL